MSASGLTPLRWSRAAGAAAAAIGLIAFAGWAWDVAVFKAATPSSAAMQPMTALAMMLAGCALWLAAGEGRAFRIPAALLVALALVTIGEYGGLFAPVLDRLLFPDALADQAAPYPYPGRMAPATAIMLLGVGAALLMARDGPFARLLARMLVGAVLLIDGIVLTGFAIDDAPMASVGFGTGMAVQSAAGLALLGVGVWVLVSDEDETSGESSRVAALRRLLAALEPTRRLPGPIGIVLGALLGATVVGAQVRIGGMPVEYPFMLAPAVTIAVAMLFGRAAAVSAVLMQMLLIRYYVFEPVRSLRIGSAEDEAAFLLAFAVQIATAIIIETLIEAIRERAVQQERIAQSEARAGLAIDAAAIGIHDYDVVAGTIEWDARVRSLWGVGPDEAITYDSFMKGLHPDDRAPTHAAVAGALDPDGDHSYRAEYRVIPREDGRTRWIAATGRAFFDEERPIRLVGTVQDVTSRKEGGEALAASEARLRTLIEATTDIIWVRGARGEMIEDTSQWAEFTGRGPDSCCGEGWLQDIHPDDRERVRGDWLGSVAAGCDYRSEYRLRRADGEYRNVVTRAVPVRRPDGAVREWIGTTTDVTETRAAEERETLLAREVDHRAKNLLAVVQSIVQLARADDVAAYRDAISGRIQSLARTHSLLASSRWEGASLERLVADELAPYAKSGHARLSGPALQLKPAAAQALALALHELATNAAKYGALSSAGMVDVTWATVIAEDSPERLRLRWQEGGGPPVSPPLRRGFGSSVLKSSVERQLRGSVALHWAPEGLICDIDLPIAEIAVPIADHKERALEEPPGTPAAAASRGGVRVLVLEDEALISMQIEDALASAGCLVLGAAGCVEEALALIEAETPDCALLDVNLTGENSFSVADALTLRGVPFAFCTGYAADASIPARFAGTPVLGKPFTAGEFMTVLQRIAPHAAAARIETA